MSTVNVLQEAGTNEKSSELHGGQKVSEARAVWPCRLKRRCRTDWNCRHHADAAGKAEAQTRYTARRPSAHLQKLPDVKS